MTEIYSLFWWWVGRSHDFTFARVGCHHKSLSKEVCWKQDISYYVALHEHSGAKYSPTGWMNKAVVLMWLEWVIVVWATVSRWQHQTTHQEMKMMHREDDAGRHWCQCCILRIWRKTVARDERVKNFFFSIHMFMILCMYVTILVNETLSTHLVISSVFLKVT